MSKDFQTKWTCAEINKHCLGTGKSSGRYHLRHYLPLPIHHWHVERKLHLISELANVFFDATYLVWICDITAFRFKVGTNKWRGRIL